MLDLIPKIISDFLNSLLKDVWHHVCSDPQWRLPFVSLESLAAFVDCAIRHRGIIRAKLVLLLLIFWLDWAFGSNFKHFKLLLLRAEEEAKNNARHGLVFKRIRHRPLDYSFVHSFIHSFIHAFIHSINFNSIQFIHSFIRSFRFIHSFLFDW